MDTRAEKPSKVGPNPGPQAARIYSNVDIGWLPDERLPYRMQVTAWTTRMVEEEAKRTAWNNEYDPIRESWQNLYVPGCR